MLLAFYVAEGYGTSLLKKSVLDWTEKKQTNQPFI